MNTMNLVFTLSFLLMGSISNASVFDSEIDPCHGTYSESDLRAKGNKLLEGDLNFITVKEPIPGTNIYYRLTCDRRLYSLLVIKEQKESHQQIEQALSAIAWQSTFSLEAAETLMNFINTSPSNILKGKAAFSFYYLHDVFPKVQVMIDFYEKQKFRNFYRKMLASDHVEQSSHFAQVAQKIAGYFLSTENSCYRSQFSDEIRIQGERAAKIFIPMLMEALLSHRINMEPDAVVVRSEILVALGNFAYSEFARTDKTYHDQLTYYKNKTEDKVDAQNVESLFASMKQVCP